MKRNILGNDKTHITSRGVLRTNLFDDEFDFSRFIASIFIMQYGDKLPKEINISNFAEDLLNGIALPESGELIDQCGKKIVDVHAFCIMDNHLHLLLTNLKKNGISLYLKRIKSSYSHYKNNKDRINGYKFDSPYYSKIIKTDKQLRKTIEYIHNNPKDRKEFKDNLHLVERYPYSSFQDYKYENRWGDNIIIL